MHIFNDDMTDQPASGILEQEIMQGDLNKILFEFLDSIPEIKAQIQASKRLPDRVIVEIRTVGNPQYIGCVHVFSGSHYLGRSPFLSAGRLAALLGG